KLQNVEQRRGGSAQSGDARVGITVRQPKPREAQFFQGVAGKYSKAAAVLNVVLHRVRVELHLVADRQRILLRLIEIVAAREDREPRADRAVKQVRLGEAEGNIALQSPDIGAESEGFAEAEKIVGLIGQPNVA